jgi:hypothetical protein
LEERKESEKQKKCGARTVKEKLDIVVSPKLGRRKFEKGVLNINLSGQFARH